MVFNGHTIENIDSLDEATMNEIVVMYADGIIGNRKNQELMATLVTGIFNYIRNSNSQPYNLKSILGNSYGYIFEEVKVEPSDALLTFMTQANGFSMDKFIKE